MAEKARNNLRHMMEVRGLSFREFGSRLGIGHAALYRYASGEHLPILPTAYRIAEGLGVEVQDVWPPEVYRAADVR